MDDVKHLQDNLVIALKTATGRTLEECRNALSSVNWDIEQAKSWLFENKATPVKTLLKG